VDKDVIKAYESTIAFADNFLKYIIYPTVSPSLAELGKMAGDSIRFFGLKNQINILIKAQDIFK
jgi:hypothetical protein